MKNYNRRKFLKTTAISAAGLTAASTLSNCDSSNSTPSSKGNYMGDFAAPKLKTIKTAFIGLGARGSGHLKSIAKLEGVEIVALSDLYEENIERNNKIANDIGNEERHKNIVKYWGEENKWKLMLEEIKPDVVFISTNWNNHAPMAIFSMLKEHMHLLKFQLV